jgi:hypothetical protein
MDPRNSRAFQASSENSPPSKYNRRNPRRGTRQYGGSGPLEGANGESSGFMASGPNLTNAIEANDMASNPVGHHQRQLQYPPPKRFSKTKREVMNPENSRNDKKMNQGKKPPFQQHAMIINPPTLTFGSDAHPGENDEQFDNMARIKELRKDAKSATADELVKLYSNPSRAVNVHQLMCLRGFTHSRGELSKAGFVMELLSKQQLYGKRRCRDCNKSKFLNPYLSDMAANSVVISSWSKSNIDRDRSQCDYF